MTETVSVRYKECCYDGSRIEDVIKDLEESRMDILRNHPQASNIRLNIDTYDDYGNPSADVYIQYYRPLTEEELEDRKKSFNKARQRREQEERALYVKLKEKFEGAKAG